MLQDLDIRVLFGDTRDHIEHIGEVKPLFKIYSMIKGNFI